MVARMARSEGFADQLVPTIESKLTCIYDLQLEFRESIFVPNAGGAWARSCLGG
jgi:hypothetical protein